MDSFFSSDKQNRNETRWDRIEKRHINSTKVYDHSDTAADICKSLIEHHEFISDTQFKTMIGQKPKHSKLDPNLVMDLRHTKSKRRQRSGTFALKRRTKSSVDVRLHYQKMFQLNHEIDKFKRSLESIRPKSKEVTFAEFQKFRFKSSHTSKLTVGSCVIGDGIKIPPYNPPISPIEANKISDENRHEEVDEAELNDKMVGDVENNQESVVLCPLECPIEESISIPTSISNPTECVTEKSLSIPIPIETMIENSIPIPVSISIECPTENVTSIPISISAPSECSTENSTSNPISISIPTNCSMENTQIADTVEHLDENQSADILCLSPNVTSPSISILSDCGKIDEMCFGNELDFEIAQNNAANSDDHSSKADVTIDDSEKISQNSFSSSTIQDDIVGNECQHEMNQREIEEHTQSSHELSMPKSIMIPISMPSECDADTTHAADAIDINRFMQENHISPESENISPCSSTQTDLRTVIRKEPQYIQSDDDLEFIIKPTITVNLQDTIRSNLTHPFDSTDGDWHGKSTEFHRESQIAVCQQMSILIKKPSKEAMNMNNNSYSCSNEHTEGSEIINELLSKKPHENFILLQRYFLKWVHFTTIEKLKRRNPAQTRLQKMEAFLQNITYERKRALNKLRRPGNILSKRDEDSRRVTMHDPNMNAPRILERTFNNKLKTQQDIIELQKIKLQRQQRIITELKLSKLLDDTNGSENFLKNELEVVAKNGCAHSRSKAKCLQIAGNLKEKTKEADVKESELAAKGISAPKFLIEMQARALDRQMRHEEAQRRREALDREKEALRLAAEEEKRLLDEDAKRQRIKEYWRKRREEKELEAKKALERMKYLANIQVAKAFNRQKLLSQAMDKFKNIIKWKIRNKRVSMEMRRRIIFRNIFLAWRNYTINIYEERKNKAIAFHNHHCLKIAWNQWIECFLVMQSKKMLAEDWFHLRLSERVFRAWERVTAHSRLVFEMKQRQAEAHFNWYMKWKVIERWRRLHSILKIEKETLARRERWRSKISELIPDYSPSLEFI